MAEPASPSDLLVANLDHVRRVAAFTARRVGLAPDDTEECVAWIELRLIEDDYGLLRKFRGESSFKTFVTVVVAMLVRDYRRLLYGKWRPSAAAARLGELAIRLERAIHRDGLSIDEAVRTVQSAGAISPSERELRDLVRQLPRRDPLRPERVDADALAAHAGGDHASTHVDADERQRDGARLTALLNAELEQLPVEDRVALQMEVVDGITIANISRSLGVPQRPLYDRLKTLRRKLRERLEVAGVSRDDVRDLLQGVAE
jgi:RNA polymerase sigma factor (sigma-70 family)